MKKIALIILMLSMITVRAEHVQWDKTPIQVALPVGEERMIHFEHPLSFSYDEGLLGDALQVASVAGTLYLKASDHFDLARTEVKLLDGTIVLLDLEAKHAAPSTPLSILMPSEDDALLDVSEHRTVGMVALTRHAIQHLYAPKRLLTSNSAIMRTPMQTTRLVAIYPFDDVKAMPLASFKDAQHYVTAVLLRNQSNKPVDLTAEDFRGDFKAMAFYPSTNLAPQGELLDTTTVFIVTSTPFAMSL